MVVRYAAALFIATIVHSGLFAAPLRAGTLTLYSYIPEIPPNTQPQSALEVLTNRPSTASSLQMRASGIWPSACAPSYDHVRNIPDGYVQIVAVADRSGEVCGQVETAWHFNVGLTLTVPYFYQIDLIVISEAQGEQYVAETTWVDVSGAIHLTPAEPEPGDEISVVVDGWHADGCVPAYDSHYTEDNTVIVEAATPDPDTVCGMALTPWSFEVDLGTMTEADQMVAVYITYRGYPEPERRLYSSVQLSSVDNRRGGGEFVIYIPGIY